MVSIIVPVKNGLPYTRALVETVRATNPEAHVEWVIVDSGSTDGTLEWAEAVGARLVHFRSDPFNYCAAVNAGAEAAAGDLWIIANNDIEFRSTLDLHRVERAFREWPILAVLCPGRAEGEAELEFRFGGLNGACWVVRPDAFRAWGGMPEQMSGYGYDEAFTQIQCWRRGLGFAWLTGWEVFHHGSVTFGPEAGNVTPALRRNLSRLLRVVGAEDLDTADPPARIIERLYAREQAAAPARLLYAGLEPGLWERHGYVNAKASAPADSGAAWVTGDPETAAAAQWLPWLANELLLQPAARIVGTQGWWAVRDRADLATLESEKKTARTLGARAIGPPPPRMMPPLAPRRATLRQRLSALVHTFRQRGKTLPEGW